MAVQPIPKGYHSLTPYLAIEDAAKAIGFYKEAFGAKEVIRMPGPDGKIAHAELEIGDSKLMLSDPFEESSVRPPSEVGGPTSSIFMYVEDCDATFEQATRAGAEVTSPLQDMFWGDRFGSLTDPFGHLWSIATHKEDLSEEEMAERSKAAMSQMS